MMTNVIGRSCIDGPDRSGALSPLAVDADPVPGPASQAR